MTVQHIALELLVQHTTEWRGSLDTAAKAITPTLLVDEADTFLRDSPELRGVINAGHQRGALAVRTSGDNHEPTTFRTWGPKAIALIGKPHPTLASRAIHIMLRRMAPGESAEPVRADRLGHLKPLARQAARWADDNELRLRESDPAMPATLTGRRADNWRHLFAIAEVAGGDWPDRVRRAAEQLAATDSSDMAAVTLLADMRRLLAAADDGRLLSADIAKALGDMEDRPWPEFKSGKPITPRQIARLLEPFRIAPKTIRIAAGGRGKGYDREDFADAFARYLPDDP